jgi:hypothetical protein
VVRHRHNRGGNRQLNKVIHLAAVTQIRNGAQGRDHYLRKLAEGKGRGEAMRSLKTAAVGCDLAQAGCPRPPSRSGLEGQSGTRLDVRVTGLHPYTGALFSSQPGPHAPPYAKPNPPVEPNASRRAGHFVTPTHPTPTTRPDTQRHQYHMPVAEWFLGVFLPAVDGIACCEQGSSVCGRLEKLKALPGKEAVVLNARVAGIGKRRANLVHIGCVAEYTVQTYQQSFNHRDTPTGA